MVACSSCHQDFSHEKDIINLARNWQFTDDKKIQMNCLCGNQISLETKELTWLKIATESGAVRNGFYSRLMSKDYAPIDYKSLYILQKRIITPGVKTEGIGQELKNNPYLLLKLLQLWSLDWGSKSQEEINGYLTRLGQERYNTPMLWLLTGASYRGMRFVEGDYNLKEHWDEAVNIGKIAVKLQEICDSNFSHFQLYLSGSLSTIGKLIWYCEEPEDFLELAADIEKQFGRDGWHKCFVQEDLVRIDRLGAFACNIWGDPGWLVHNIYDSFDYELTLEKSKGSLVESDLIKLAYCLGSGVELPERKTVVKVSRVLECKPEDIENMLLKIKFHKRF